MVTVISVSASAAATREVDTVKAGPRPSKDIKSVGQGLDMPRYKHSCNIMKVDTRGESLFLNTVLV